MMYIIAVVAGLCALLMVFVLAPNDSTGSCERPRYFGGVCGEPE
jgi:hypothetical protein